MGFDLVLVITVYLLQDRTLLSLVDVRFAQLVLSDTNDHQRVSAVGFLNSYLFK